MDHDQFYHEIMEMVPIIYRINRSFSQTLEDDELCMLPPNQLHTVLTLRNKGTVNMTKLAESMLMTRQQLTKIIDGLVERGFVERIGDPSNRRHVLIGMTAEGNDYIERLFYRPSRLSRLLQEMDEADNQRMFDAIRTIREVLARVNERITTN